MYHEFKLALDKYSKDDCITVYHGYILLKQQLCDYFKGMHDDALCWYEFHGENWHKGRLSPYQVISKMSGQMNWNLTISLV